MSLCIAAHTASSVPHWITAEKPAPGSFQPSHAGTIRRWAVLEIGRNSVSPCTTPSVMASRIDMGVGLPVRCGTGGTGTWIEKWMGAGALRGHLQNTGRVGHTAAPPVFGRTVFT